MSIIEVNKQEEEKPQQRVPGTPATMEELARAGHAVRRLKILKDMKVHTPQSEAELRGVQTFLIEFCMEHVDELIGSTIAIKTEYEPLVGVLASLLRRAGDLNAHRYHAQQERAKQEAADEEAKK
jgi:hypothetical protein